MSGIAEVLANQNYRVRGSDVAESANVQRLRDRGIEVAIGHDAKNLGDAAEDPRFLTVGLSGVWNFRGRIGKTTMPGGERRDVKGLIPDFDRIAFEDRRVTILFDANADSNDSVNRARQTLAVARCSTCTGRSSWVPSRDCSAWPSTRASRALPPSAAPSASAPSSTCSGLFAIRHASNAN